MGTLVAQKFPGTFLNFSNSVDIFITLEKYNANSKSFNSLRHVVKVEVYVVNRIGLSTETHQRFDRNSLKKKAVWQLLLLFSDERKMA